MAYVDIKALVTSIAKVTQWLATSKRMLLIVSPFLAIVAVLVWLAIVSIDILTAGRAYVEGESLWSKNQKEAVFHLLRFAETQIRVRFPQLSEGDSGAAGFPKRQVSSLKIHSGLSAVRPASSKAEPNPDDIPASSACISASPRELHEERARYMADPGDDFLARLDAAAEELHAFHLSVV